MAKSDEIKEEGNTIDIDGMKDEALNNNGLEGVVSNADTSKDANFDNQGSDGVKTAEDTASKKDKNEVEAEVIDEDAEIANNDIGDNLGKETYGPEVASEAQEEAEEQTPATPTEPVKEKRKIGLVGGVIIGAAAVLVAAGAILGGLFGGGVLSTASQEKSIAVSQSNWTLSNSEKTYLNKFVRGLGVSSTAKVERIAGLVPVMNPDAKYSMQLCLNVKDQTGSKLVTVNLDDETFGDVKTTKELISALRDAGKDKIGEVKTFEKMETAKALEGKAFKETYETICMNKEAGFVDDIYVCISGGKTSGKVDALGITYDGFGDVNGYYYKEGVFTLTNKVKGVKSEDVEAAFRSSYGAEGQSYSGIKQDNLSEELNLSSYADVAKEEETEEKTEEENKPNEIVDGVKTEISSIKKFDGWDISFGK